MNRIDKKFEELKKEGKKAFIPYICAGDPSIEDTEKLIYALEESGCDVIELGVPYSDPLADGPVIQAAGLRSLNGGYKLGKMFDMIKRVREKSEMPIAVMVYYSTIFGYGKEKFVNECVEAGVDGLVIPDLPYEEYDEIKPIIDKTELAMVPLIAITSNERIPMLVKEAKGFIYCVSSLGVTGERKNFDKRVDEFIENVKKNTNVPVCVGFGISKREDVERFEKTADGVIVGSAIVKTIFNEKMNIENIKGFVKGLSGVSN